MRTHVDLFTGIGGFTRAAEACGVRTIAMCEIDPRCRAFLAKAWPGIPIHDDVRTFRLAGARGAAMTKCPSGIVSDLLHLYFDSSTRDLVSDITHHLSSYMSTLGEVADFLYARLLADDRLHTLYLLAPTEALRVLLEEMREERA